jgi:hypothetical protein
MLHFNQCLSLCFTCRCFYGDEETRTPDLRRARAALSQLSYIPSVLQVGLVGLEPTTSPLSEERSNRLSYKPIFAFACRLSPICVRFLLFLSLDS